MKGLCSFLHFNNFSFFISAEIEGSPYINHFLQPDTLIPDPTNPQAWNRYSYVGNNPVNFNDPTGHKLCDDEFGCEGKNKLPSSLPKPDPKPDDDEDHPHRRHNNGGGAGSTPPQGCGGYYQQTCLGKVSPFRQGVAQLLSIGGATVDFIALGVSFKGSVIEISRALLGIEGGLAGVLAGFVEGTVEYNIYFNHAENILGWVSFGLVAGSDIFAGNSKLNFNRNTQQTELTIGQDTLVSLAAAKSGSDYPGEALSDTQINGAIFAYDVLRLTNIIPTVAELRVSVNGISLSSP